MVWPQSFTRAGSFRLNWSATSRSVRTAGNSSQSIRRCSSASRASRSVGAAISATGSPAYRNSSDAMTGIERSWLTMQFGPGMSFAVTTTTRDQSKAGSGVSPRSRPWGTGARTTWPNQPLGMGRSSTYWVRPRTLSSASTRGMPLPTQ